MAIVYTAGIPATPPPGVPDLPDITTALLAKWRFNDLGLTDGAPIASTIPAVGGSRGSAANLSDLHATTSRRPTIAVGYHAGHDALRFTAASAQFIGTTLYASGQETIQPCTKYAVFARASNTSGYLMTGGVSSSVAKGQRIEMITSAMARAVAVGGTGGATSTAPYDTSIHVLVACYDGADSYISIDDHVDYGSLIPGANSIDPRDNFGSNEARSGTYFDGWLLGAGTFSRALPEIDRAGLVTSLRDEFSLT